MCSSESSHNYESRVQSDDSSKACSKHRFFYHIYSIVSHTKWW